MINIINLFKIFMDHNNSNQLLDEYLSNQKHIDKLIYSRKTENSHMTPVMAAKYCVSTATLKENGDLEPFYVLAQTGDIYTNLIKNSYNIMENVSQDILLYLKKNERNEKSKEFFVATSSVISYIENIAKKETIIGYTNDPQLVDKFLTFEISLDMSDAMLDEIWRNDSSSETRMYILRKLLGTKKELFSNKIIGTIFDMDRPFKTIAWKLIKYQIEQNTPMDEKVFLAINYKPEIQYTLRDGNRLKGLNLSNQLQLCTIVVALQLNSLYCTTSYIDDLWNGDAWLNETEMEKKYHEYKALLDPDNMSPEIRMKHEQTVIEQRKQKQERKAQIESEKRQIAAIKEQSRATLKAQIAQLKAQEDALRSQFYSTPSSDWQTRAKISNQANALSDQRTKLQSELDKI